MILILFLPRVLQKNFFSFRFSDVIQDGSGITSLEELDLRSAEQFLNIFQLQCPSNVSLDVSKFHLRGWQTSSIKSQRNLVPLRISSKPSIHRKWAKFGKRISFNDEARLDKL